MRAVSRALMVLESRAPSALGRHGDVSLGLTAQAIILSALRASSLLHSETDSKIRHTPRLQPASALVRVSSWVISGRRKHLLSVIWDRVRAGSPGSAFRGAMSSMLSVS